MSMPRWFTTAEMFTEQHSVNEQCISYVSQHKFWALNVVLHLSVCLSGTGNFASQKSPTEKMPEVHKTAGFSPRKCSSVANICTQDCQDITKNILLLHKSGTIYLLLSESHHHLTPSNITSKLTTLPRHNNSPHL